MFAKSIFTAGAVISLVAAVPMQNAPYPKRDIVWETHTEVAMTTIPVTVTHWLEPGETAPTGNKQHYGHGAGHGGYSHQSSAAAPETTAPAEPETTASAVSPSSTPEAPSPSSYEQPSSQYVAPTSTSTYVASTPSSTYVAPVATTAAPPAPETTTSAAPPAYTTPSSGGGSAPSGQEYTGDITHYDVGLGSCGTTHTDKEDVVAIPPGIMANPANPNLNPLCGTFITISYGGQEHTAEVVDTCGGCYATSIDLSPTLFEKVAPQGNGRVSDVKWWFNN